MLFLLCIAALAQEPDPEEIPDEAPVLQVAEETVEIRDGAWASLSLGPSLGFASQGLGLAVRLEAGPSPRWQRRLRPMAVLGLSRARTTDSADSELLPEPQYDWVVADLQLQLSLGAALVLGSPDATLRPSLVLAPQLVAARSAVQGTTGEQEMGTLVQWSLRPGWLAGLQVAGPLGPGEAFFRGALTGGPIRSELMDDASTLSLDPALGYRIPL